MPSLGTIYKAWWAAGDFAADREQELKSQPARLEEREEWAGKWVRCVGQAEAVELLMIDAQRAAA